MSKARPTSAGGAPIRLLILLALCGLLKPAASQAEQPPAAAIYVSPTGDDAADGRTSETPWRTLEHARDAARTGEAKTIYLLPGSYPRTKPLELGALDVGEKWVGLGEDPAILQAFAEIDSLIQIRSKEIAISGLTFRGPAHNGIRADNSEAIAVFDNDVSITRGVEPAQGGINFLGTSKNIEVARNHVHDVPYMGIIVENAKQDHLEYIRIHDNRVVNTCRSYADCGGIYIDDRSISAHDVFIYSNLVANFSEIARGGRGIYLDDYISRSDVYCNYISGPGTYAIQIHGGKNIIIEQNVINLKSIEYLILYQQQPDQKRGGPMTDNIFRKNLILNSAKDIGSRIQYIIDPPSKPPHISNNMIRSSSATGESALSISVACARRGAQLPATENWRP